jgi:hypothetical protein
MPTTHDEDTITISYTREQLENLWNIKITDKMWVDLQHHGSGFQYAVHQEVEGLREYISDFCDYCSDPETDDETDWDERDIKILGFNTKDRLDGDYQSLLFEIRNHEFKLKKKKKKIIKKKK